MKLLRQCTKCKKLKTADKFYAAKKGRDGLRAWCIACHTQDGIARQQADRPAANARARAYKTRNPGQVRLSRKKYTVRKNYGLSLEEYNAKIKNAKCEICGNKIKRARHCLDHCHTTGRVRGVLCNACNRGLGFFRDDPDVLESAAEYLRRYSNS